MLSKYSTNWAISSVFKTLYISLCVCVCFIYVCVPAWVYVHHVHVGTFRIHNTVSSPLELELQVVLSHYVGSG